MGPGGFGSNNSPSTWTTLTGANLPTVSFRPAGTAVSPIIGGTLAYDRIELIWADTATPKIIDTWLEVIVKANANTGLLAQDVFYFGNMPGDVNNDSDPDFKSIDALDEAAIRMQSTLANSDLYYNGIGTAIQNLLAALANKWDVNRDDNVDAVDQNVARTYSNFPYGELDMIKIGAAGPFAPDGGDGDDDEDDWWY